MTEKTDTIKIEIKREFIDLHSYTLYSPNKETYIHTLFPTTLK